MAPVSVLEEGSCALKSCDLKKIRCLYDKICKELHESKRFFIKEGEHISLLKEKNRLSRCHLSTWCLPKVAKDFIPLR